MIECDVLVIGSGLAGCITALTAADASKQVVMLTKTPYIQGGSTSCAQGGIIFRGENDSPELLKQDIESAGVGLCHEPALQAVTQEGPKLVEEWLLRRLEVPFTTNPQTRGYHLTAEAAHSVPRILHCADHTGKVIHDRIATAIANHPRIQVLSNSIAVDLLTTNHHSNDPKDIYLAPRCFGCFAFNSHTSTVQPIFSQHTVLATGGIGQLYLHTTNPAEARGDGIAMAWRAGARCINLHLIQFHPTAIYHPSGRFLVSEAVRGEGGILVDVNGNQFMHKFHSDGSLAPRDVVAKAIHITMLEQHASCVFLDISHRPATWIKERFPSIYKQCSSLGIDMTKQPIPVVPAVHYSIGGISTDTHASTNIQRLYAVGEVACTGLHGANRLASTSLLECITFGDRAGRFIAQSEDRLTYPGIDRWTYENEDVDPALIAQDWLTIRNIMWNYVGLSRTPKRLQRACEMLRHLQLEIEEFYKKAQLSDSIIGLRNGVQTALSIALEASKVRSSMGCHFISTDG